jgi:peptidoglycan/xylan/chitin deacetylase (PgdA/CDA1 family)
VRAGRGGIVLMHCGPDATAAAVPAIIRWYQSRGYQLVGLGRLLGS